jgi:hypothetical protein
MCLLPQWKSKWCTQWKAKRLQVIEEVPDGKTELGPNFHYYYRLGYHCKSDNTCKKSKCIKKRVLLLWQHNNRVRQYDFRSSTYISTRNNFSIFHKKQISEVNSHMRGKNKLRYWNTLIPSAGLTPMTILQIIEFTKIIALKSTLCIILSRRSRWPHVLRRRSASARLLRSWVPIPSGAWIFICLLRVLCVVR